MYDKELFNLVHFSVVPPQVTIEPANITVESGDNVTISCTVYSEALLLENQLIFNGTQTNYGKILIYSV